MSERTLEGYIILDSFIIIIVYMATKDIWSLQIYKTCIIK